MKMCKQCNGMGFEFDRLLWYGENRKLGWGLNETGVKLPCKKCFGKGMK